MKDDPQKYKDYFHQKLIRMIMNTLKFNIF